MSRHRLRKTSCWDQSWRRFKSATRTGSSCGSLWTEHLKVRYLTKRFLDYLTNKFVYEMFKNPGWFPQTPSNVRVEAQNPQRFFFIVRKTPKTCKDFLLIHFLLTKNPALFRSVKHEKDVQSVLCSEVSELHTPFSPQLMMWELVEKVLPGSFQVLYFLNFFILLFFILLFFFFSIKNTMSIYF